MDFDSQQERLLEDVVKLAAARKRAFKPVTVLIDGPSGAGKTWTSAALAERTNEDKAEALLDEVLAS